MSEYGYRPPGAAPEAPRVFPKLDIGDVFQTSASIVGSNFASFIVVALIFSVPGMVLSSIASANQMEGQLAMQMAAQNGDFAGALEAMPIAPVFFSMAIGFLNAILIYMGMGTLMFASVEHMAGRKPGLGDVISRGLSQAPSIAIVALVVLIGQFVAVIPGMVAMVLGIFAAAAGDAPGLICCIGPFGVLLMLAPVTYLVILFFLAIPVAVVERSGPVNAITRSIELTKSHRGVIFMILFLVVLVFILFIVLGSCCVGAGAASSIDPTTMQMQETSMMGVVAGFVIGLITSVIRVMVMSAIVAVVYARIRGLKDGVDANAIAQVFS